MKMSINYTLYRGWDIEEFEISGEIHYRAVKNGTTIAIKGEQQELFDLLDSIDFRQKINYNTN